MSTDIRETLIEKYSKEGWSGDAQCIGYEDAKLMLDEYFERRVKEDLLPWMAKNRIECFIDTDEEETLIFQKGNNFLTANELFQNFL